MSNNEPVQTSHTVENNTDNKFGNDTDLDTSEENTEDEFDLSSQFEFYTFPDKKMDFIEAEYETTGYFTLQRNVKKLNFEFKQNSLRERDAHITLASSNPFDLAKYVFSITTKYNIPPLRPPVPVQYFHYHNRTEKLLMDDIAAMELEYWRHTVLDFLMDDWNHERSYAEFILKNYKNESFG